jgi:succinate-acetate transporter protein
MAEQQVSENQVRAVLQPIAAPSILGLYAFAGSTFIVSAHLAGWYGGPDTPLYLLPFAAVFGGVAQFAAGMWAYKARDGIATAMHGMWGSFWVGFGLLELLIAAGVIPPNEGSFPGFAYWFIALAAITLMGTIAAAAENLALTAVLGVLTAGASAAAIAGYTFMISAFLAWYTASALMFEGVGRPILPVGMTKQARQMPDVNPGEGEPGVAKGQ